MSIVHLATFLIEKKKFFFFSRFTMKIKRKKKQEQLLELYEQYFIL